MYRVTTTSAEQQMSEGETSQTNERKAADKVKRGKKGQKLL